MYSSSDFEKLWFLYKTEGEPQGISINTFCLTHGIPYRDFNSWFVKTRKKIVPVQIERVPSSDSALEESPVLVCAESALIQSNLGMNSGNILVTIQTRDGLNIRKSNLDYRSRYHRDPLQRMFMFSCQGPKEG